MTRQPPTAVPELMANADTIITIPDQWRAYAFKARYQGRLISVQVTPDGATFELLAGEPLEILVGDTSMRLDCRHCP